MINKMKRVNSFLIAAFVAASSMLVVSCNDENEEDNPKVTVKAYYVDSPNNDPLENGGSKTLPEGTTVKFEVLFEKGKNKLSYAKVESSIAGTMLDQKLNEGWLNRGEDKLEFTYSTVVVAGTNGELLTVTAYDTKTPEPRAIVFTYTLKATTQAPPDATNKYVVKGEIQLGGQTHKTLGSFYSVHTGLPYLLVPAKTNSADIDFAYWQDGTSGGATIYSPDAAAAATKAYSTTDNNITKWSTKRATLFYKVGTVSINANSTPDQIKTAITALKDGNWWDDVTPANLTLTKADNLAVGSVVAFKTDRPSGSITEAFVVTGTSTSNDGAISFRIIEAYTE